MCAHLELIAAFLIDMRATKHGVLLDPRRQRHGTPYLCTGPLGRIDDFLGGSIENTVVKSLQADPDILTVHCCCSQ